MKFNVLKMTKLFLEENYSSGGGRHCRQCKGPSEKSLCSIHLKKARLEWREWTKNRILNKLCVVCDKHSHLVKETGVVRQGVFCRVHREINRRRCLAWARSNRKMIRAQYASRVQKHICTNSDSHGKSYREHTVCRNCYFRKKVYMEKYRKNQRGA